MPYPVTKVFTKNPQFSVDTYSASAIFSHQVFCAVSAPLKMQKKGKFTDFNT